MSQPTGTFWMIGYGKVVWDRTITAFVPMAVLKGSMSSPVAREVIDRFAFDNEAEVDAQVTELKALGVDQVVKKGYVRSTL